MRAPRIRPPRIGFSWSLSSLARQAARALMALASIAFVLAACLHEWRVITSAGELGDGGVATIVINSVPALLLGVMVACGWWLRWRRRPGWGLALVVASAALMSLMLLF